MDDQLRGHRNRVRERYLNTGLDAKSTAKNLISRFGSLPAVLDATSAELTEAGLSPNAAILLKLVPDMNRYYAVKTDGAGQKVHSTSDAGRILCAMFRHEQTESVRLLCLNAGGKVLKLALLNEGDINAVHFSVRKIVETALSAKAVSVILAHNHPGGTLTPSREDLDATNSAKAALSTVGIQLLDHLIISGDNYCSLREDGYL